MTQKLMLINVTDDESRIAVVEDNLLQDMLIEHETREQLKNNIYKAVVVQIQTALQAAFVDFGNKKHGFLPNSEINPVYFHSSRARKDSPIQHKLKVGQEIIVQVTREAIEHKGAALTTNVTIPGRFMVMMPESTKGGVSKKIEDEDERTRLKSFLSGIESEEHAVIIRTAGMGRDLVELKKDYTALKKTWADINRTFRSTLNPGLIKEEDDVVTRTLRDYYTEDISEIWVDNAETFQKALNFFKKNAPRRQKDLKLFVGDRSLFATHNIERQVEQLTAREVKLRSGGSIVIDQTEALVAIDVNSGKSNRDENIDDTAFRTNMEAAKEIARQLRLRNLGGLIVVDFIDMETDGARNKVEQQIQNAMSRDKAQRKYSPISQFGLLEMSRQRLTQGISRTVESICPTCSGKGKIPSVAASTNLILRSIREIAAKGNLIKVEGTLPLALANTLLNERRQSITDLELEFGINISLKGDPDMDSFSDRCLKPTYDGKAPQRKSEETSKRNRNNRSNRKSKDSDHNGRHSRSEQNNAGKQESVEPSSEKSESPKNSSRHRNNRNSTAELKFESSAIPPEKVAETSKKEEYQLKEPQNTEINRAEEVESQKEAPAPKAKTHKRSKASKSDFKPTLHKACLFPEVKELSETEVEEIMLSFKNRLKGKTADKPFVQYDAQFLWLAEPEETASSPEVETADSPAEAKSEETEISPAEETDSLPEETLVEEKEFSESLLEKEPTAFEEKYPQTSLALPGEIAAEAEKDESGSADKEEVTKPIKKGAKPGRKKAAPKKAKKAEVAEDAVLEGEEKVKKTRKPAAKKPKSTAKKPARKKAAPKKSSVKSAEQADDVKSPILDALAAVSQEVSE